MAHHSREPLTTAENLRKLIENEAGPTLAFPRGRLTETDEGEIQLKIAADKRTGTVVMDFGAPTAWDSSGGSGGSAETESDISERVHTHVRGEG